MELTPQSSNEVALFAPPPLLITESADEFAALLAALQQEIKPNGIIEQIYLHDLAAIVWELQRMRRYRTGIVNNPSGPRCKVCLNDSCYPHISLSGLTTK